MALAAASAVVAILAAALQLVPFQRDKTRPHDTFPVLRTRVGAYSMALPQRAPRSDVGAAHSIVAQLRRNIHPRGNVKTLVNLEIKLKTGNSKLITENS